ncbi:hypothetical protein ACIF80_37090 [Streptomyces sp. NPDC085927]|uniref:hypothetical protein n=1 Tax=Streptomyces sp. NPDC085927 TaxID=3365738 RepID=UPI0037CDC31C
MTKGHVIPTPTTTDGFHVLSPGAPLVLQLPMGRIQRPADASMRHLARPLTSQVSYRAGVLNCLLADPLS